MSEESVERVRQSFLRSPKKSVRRESCELEMSSMTVWMLRKRLQMKPYHLHLLHLLKPTDHIDRTNFCIKMQDAMMEEGFLDRLCLVMSLCFISMGKCTDIMCVYGVLKILMRWCNMKGLPQRSIFFAQCPPERFMDLSFSVKTL